MPYSNISAVISAADKAAIIGHINAIKALLPFLINLTPEEKIAFQKMGNQRLAFVTKALEYAAANPTLVPGYLPLPEANKDFNLNADLRQIFEVMSTLGESIEETGMAAGTEVYDFARAFYANVQEAAKRNVPGTGTIATDLGELFEGQGDVPPPVVP